MQAGQPFTIYSILPDGMTPTDAYTLMVAGAAFLVIWSIGNSLSDKDKLTPRLKMIAQRRQELKNAQSGPKKREKVEKNIDWMRNIVNKLQLVQENQVERLTHNLVQAGYRSKDALVIYGFSNLIFPILGLATPLILVDVNWDNPFVVSEATNWLMIIGSSYVCTRLPSVLLNRQKSKRHGLIQRALPDTLDLMMICAEAGLSLGATLDRVSRELGETYLEMAEELSFTSIELGFLPDRNIALKHLAERVDIPEVRGIVNVLQQTEKYGTPISQALRTLSQEFRTARMLRAEQKAARLPALMTIPMIVFILPTLFVIVLSPAIIKLMDVL